MRSLSRLRIAVAAAASGAAGLGVETVLLQTSATALGQGRVGTIGIGAYVAGWSLGAWLAGRVQRATWAALLLAAFWVPLLGGIAWIVLHLLGARPAEAVTATGGAALALALAAVPQGAVLPLLVRTLERGEGRPIGRAVALLYGAGLLGSVVGAWWAGHGRWTTLRWLGPGTEHGLVAVACASLVGLVGVVACAATARGARRDAPVAAGAGPGAALPFALAALVVGLVTAWMLAVEGVVVRLGVLYLGGMQLGLSALLAAALTGLTLGALFVAPWIPRGARGVAGLVLLACCATLWPFAFGALGATGRPAGWWESYALACGLAVPALLPFGAVLPVLHRSIAGEGGARLGRLLLHESWGALGGALLLTEVAIPRFGLGGSLACCCVLGVAGALLLARAAPGVALPVATGALVLAALAGALPEPALASPPLANPALTVRSFAEDEHFAVTVVDDGLIGERTLLTDEFRAAGTGRDYTYMRALGHLPVLLHPDPRRVAVVALGTGTTVGAVSLHQEVERIDVLEISRAVVAAAPWFEEVNRGALKEGLPGLLHEGDGADRVVVRLGDARRTLAAHGPYDVITMEPLLPSSPFGVHLYTLEFYELVRAALAPGGLVCQWIPPHALEPESFREVLHTATSSFDWSGTWVFGTQMLVIAGDGPPGPPSEGRGGSSSVLAEELSALGLASAAQVFGRGGGDWRDDSSYPSFSDAAPWILHAPVRSAAERLAYLPRNFYLGRPPRAGSSELPSAGEAELERQRRGRRALYAARRRWGWLEVLRVDPNASVDLLEGPDGRSPEWQRKHGERAYIKHLRASLEGVDHVERLARARELLGDDAELRAFADEIEFLQSLRRGVELLSAAAAGAALDARTVLDPLTRAAELRPERADVHVYNAAAFAHYGFDEAARKAAAFARERCPRIAGTAAGRRALALGLPADLLAR